MTPIKTIKMVVAKNKNELKYIEQCSRIKKINKFNGVYNKKINSDNNKQLNDFGIKHLTHYHCPICKSYNIKFTDYGNVCLNCGYHEY